MQGREHPSTALKQLHSLGWAQRMHRPRLQPHPRGFVLALVFPPAVAGMWWPLEQCSTLRRSLSAGAAAAAQAQPCSQGALRKHTEMTLATVSCGRTRWIPPPLLQQGPRGPEITAVACNSPVPSASSVPALQGSARSVLTPPSPGCACQMGNWHRAAQCLSDSGLPRSKGSGEQ